MPRRLLAVLCTPLLVAAMLSSALAADSAKKPDDFRGIRWGAAPSSLPGLSAVDRDGDIVHYDRPNEKKDLGGIPLHHVTYSFYKDQFYHAEIGYDGQGAFEAIQRSLEEKYGPPDAVRQKTDPSGQAYEVAIWNWPGFAFIGNRHDKGGSRGRIFYFYAPLTDVSAKSQGLGPASAKPGTYTVQKGDTLSRLARQFAVSEAELIQANPGLTDKSLKAGATIAVPGKAAPQGAKTPDKPAGVSPDRTPAPVAASSPAASSSPTPGGMIEYKVKEGDILSKVANANGARTRDVIAANPGINPDSLRPGTILKIPVAKPAGTPSAPDAVPPAPAPATPSPAPAAP